MADGPPVDTDDPRPFGSAHLASLRDILAASRIGTWRWDEATGVVVWDETLEALCGLGPGEFGATYEAWLATLHPDEVAGILDVVALARERRSSYHFEHRTIWPDGTTHWLECRGQVTVDRDGNPTGTVGCAVDITERKTSEIEQAALVAALSASTSRLERLQRVSHDLGQALAVDDVITPVMEALDAPQRASARLLWLMGDDDSLHLAAHHGILPEAVEQFARIPRDSPLPAAVACRERRTIISPSHADTVERFPDLRDAPRTAQGFVAVPLRIEDDAVGVLAFGYSGALDHGDVMFLEAAAGHIAQAISRARLAELLARRADEAAEVANRERRRREHLEFLAAVTQAAIKAPDHRALMHAVATAAVPTLGDWCSVHFVAGPASTIETVVFLGDGGADDEVERITAQYPYDELGILRAMANGQTSVDAAGTRTWPASLGAYGPASTITVPIRTKRRVIGALQVARATPDERYDHDDVAMAEAVAGRIGDALENMWLTEQHRHISTTLQEAFLPPRLPTVDHLDVFASYWPAGPATDVGGDFYDLFPIDARTTALVIGDVCGTGPNAAALTSIARHTARAAARHGCAHDEVLGWVNQAILLSDRDLFSTLGYATIEQPTAPGEPMKVRCTSGGHPLPIHRGSDGARIIGTPGTLLGVFDTITTEEADVELQPGDLMVFYTDGITDLPPPLGRTASELAQLIEALPTSLTSKELGEAIRADLLARVPDVDRHDDVALLVIRFAP